MFSIVTDGSADLTPALYAQYNIHVVPFSCCVEGRESLYLPGDDARPFYAALRARADVSTSQISPGRFWEAFEPLLGAGEDALFISISSRVSGSFASAGMARDMLRGRYPERQLIIFDSLGASLGVGLLALYAAECRDAGLSLRETVARLRERRARLCQTALIADLSHLKRTGRVSAATAALGKAIHMYPLLKAGDTGELVLTDKVRGKKAALAALAERLFTLAVNPEEQLIGIAHGDCPEDAAALEELLRRKITPKGVLTVCVAPPLGAHFGPDMLGLFFLGEKNVRFA